MIDNKKVILAIESSCDETSVAILVGEELKCNIISSQIKEHISFGGVYPELASRLHVEKIDYVISKAIQEANVSFEDLDYICVTKGPGLPGALQIGMMASKVLSGFLNIPLIGVHHLMGHIYANEYIEKIKYPSLAVIISGGNTELVLMKDQLNFELIGQTLDDAIGESFDKIARKLDLPYPGGVNIDKLTKDRTDIELIKFPKPHIKGFDVSYSGLKSAVSRMIDEDIKNNLLDETRILQYAYSTEVHLIDQLLNKVFLAAKTYNIKQIVFGGGVSANSYLRKQALKLGKKNNVEILIPPLWCTTDNAAMIAIAGKHLIEKGYFSSLKCTTNPSLELELPYED